MLKGQYRYLISA
jgi:hypothetical protein